MNVYPEHVRPVLRQLLVSALPGPINAQRRIAVVGLPRSGTSWLAKAIALADRVQYYFEPDRVYQRSYLYPYPTAATDNSELLAHCNTTFKGGIHNSYTIAEQDFSNIIGAYRAQTVLVKWVRFCLCLEWLAETFPDLMIVQTVRNPVPLFLSWRARDWTPDHSLNQLLALEPLMNGPLQPFSGVMRGAETYWQKAGAFWAANTYMQQRYNQPGWILKEHEWYCEDSVGRIKWLVEELGLNWNADIENFLSMKRKNKTGPGYGKIRDPKTELTKWHGKISETEMAELRGVVEQFELPFYTDLFGSHPAS